MGRKAKLWTAEQAGSEAMQARESTARLQNQRITAAQGARAKKGPKT